MLGYHVCTALVLNSFIVEKMSDYQLDSKELWQQKLSHQEKQELRWVKLTVAAKYWKGSWLDVTGLPKFYLLKQYNDTWFCKLGYAGCTYKSLLIIIIFLSFCSISSLFALGNVYYHHLTFQHSAV